MRNNGFVKPKRGFHEGNSFHDFQKALSKPGRKDLNKATRLRYVFTYDFENFFHPFVGELIGKLNRESLEGLLDPDYHENLETAPSSQLPGNLYTANPEKDDRIDVQFHNKDIDVKPGGPYANYNWELFFHLPFAIAVHLSKNQRFAEAQRWFHFIFDPTATDVSPDMPEHVWRFIAFRNGKAEGGIVDQLVLLATPDSELSTAERNRKRLLLEGYQAILRNPFQPHAIARTRHVAYMYAVVMKYLDNLIAWGDHLFRQDTMESINEATQLYVLAANILGPRPEQVPRMGRVQAKTFSELRNSLDPVGNALVQLELSVNSGTPSGNGTDGSSPLFGIGRTLYFCVPRNEKLLGYWDIVADRLFKIRHCMNIEGVVRQLALFDPPIDPGMLVKAAAAGIDIGAIVSGRHQPPGQVRARLLIQKALELCTEVRNLGSALLSAIEKEDAERLSQLRQRHEIRIQQLQQEVRFLQWKQAQEATEGLLRSRAVMLERYRYYLRLLGRKPDEERVPETLPLDRRELTEENFDEAYEALVGQYERAVETIDYPELKQPLWEAISSFIPSLDKIISPGNLHLTMSEFLGLNILPQASATLKVIAASIGPTTAVLSHLPKAKAKAAPMGVGSEVEIAPGEASYQSGSAGTDALLSLANLLDTAASVVNQTASYERRADDWILQANLAARELRQIGRQIIASLIAEQIARRDYENVRQQIEHSREVDRFLREKFSNAELYAWMQGELSRLHHEYYRFAFDVARQAEETMKRELMRPELNERTFVKFNYWDAGRKGLLAGEALQLDVRRMEMAYLEHNRREYEMTKHVSLLQVDPLALVKLRATGYCTVRLPESLFDMDGPGHYCRRIKMVALSIPCVTGPYIGVNCKLTLLKNSIRVSPVLSDGYDRQGPEDERFQDDFGGVQSVVTSSARQDSGLFENSLNDERYLPFENAGVISEWRLELPADPSKEEPAQFDYDTISDVILHIRYTAREGGATLREAAMASLKQQIENARAAGSVRLFSIRHEFPTEWARFMNRAPDAGRHELVLVLRPEHYPFWSQNIEKRMQRMDILARVAPDGPNKLDIYESVDAEDALLTLTKDPELGDLLHGVLTPEEGLPATGDFRLYVDAAPEKLIDLWLAVTWKAA